MVIFLNLNTNIPILGYQYWEATSKFIGWSACIEGMIYHMSQDFRGDLWILGGKFHPYNSTEINTDSYLDPMINGTMQWLPHSYQ